jgi:hypothetical protein
MTWHDDLDTARGVLIAVAIAVTLWIVLLNCGLRLWP